MPPDAKPETLLSADNIQAERILVVAPHPDDESLGCGGLIALLARRAYFNVVFVTDGGASHPNSPTWSRKQLAALREKEAKAALVNLGIGRHIPTFMRLPDSALPELPVAVKERAIAGLMHIIRTFRPDLVLLPWRRDPHGDHRNAWAMTHAALKAAQQTPATLEYAVWLEEFGEAADYPRADEAVQVAFDIARVLEAKRAAILAHVSQTTPLIDDDPTTGFCLSADIIKRLCGPIERYWKPLL